MKTVHTQPYTYSGPLSSVTLRVDGKDLDVLLNPKKPVALPPDHEFTRSLLAQKRLIPIVSSVADTSTDAGGAGAALADPAKAKGSAKASKDTKES